MMLLEGISLGLAVYFVALAIAAALGFHRQLLAYPFYAGYSLLRFALSLVSVGRVQLAPVVRGIGGGHIRLRSSILEWRERRSEEMALAHGEDLIAPTSWTTQAEAESTEIKSGELPLPSMWGANEEPSTQLPAMPRFDDES